MNLLCSYNYCPNELCFIMESTGSQKGSYSNKSTYNYANYYFYLFKNIQYEPIMLLEVGIDTNITTGRPGASLYGWRQFFPNGKIFAIDKTAENLIMDKNIITLLCDYTGTNHVRNLWDIPFLHGDLDIIIVNIPEKFPSYKMANEVVFFEASHYKVKVSGVIIIENIPNESVDLYQEQLDKWRIIYPSYAFRMFAIPNKKNNIDNRICIIQRLY